MSGAYCIPKERGVDVGHMFMHQGHAGAHEQKEAFYVVSMLTRDWRVDFGPAYLNPKSFNAATSKNHYLSSSPFVTELNPPAAAHISHLDVVAVVWQWRRGGQRIILPSIDVKIS